MATTAGAIRAGFCRASFPIGGNILLQCGGLPARFTRGLIRASSSSVKDVAASGASGVGHMRGAGRVAGAMVAMWAVASGVPAALAQDSPPAAAPAVTLASFNGVQSLRMRALATLASVPDRPVPAAAEATPPREDATPPYLIQAYACLIGGTTSMAVAYAAGAENLVNTIAGGIVPTANRGVLFLGVAGIVFASFCSLGEALTPVYLYYTEPPPAGPPPAPRDAAAVRGAQLVVPTRVSFQAGGVLGGAARRAGIDPATAPINALAQVPASQGR